MPATDVARRLTVGAELQPRGGAHVRVWAPACRRIDLVIPGAAEGTCSRRLDGERLRPDPASRAQPDGPHGASQYVDPAAYAWDDAAWAGIGRDGHVMPPVDTDAEWRMPGGCALFFVPESRTV